MNSMESSLLTYLLNSLWQIPLVFFAALLAERLVRRYAPTVEHRIWVAALALEVSLPACSSSSFSIARRLWSSWFGQRAAAANISVTTSSVSPMNPHGLLHLSPTLILSVMAGYLLVLSYLLLRMAYGFWQIHELREDASGLPLTDDLGVLWPEQCSSFGISKTELLFSSRIQSPLTFGFYRTTVLLPREWHPSCRFQDVRAALAHELAHVRRHDYGKNLLYRLLTLPVGYHPVVWFTFQRVSASREMICDRMAAATSPNCHQYAHSLLRLAETCLKPAAVPPLHAIGIFDAATLERRIMKLTGDTLPFAGSRRWLLLAPLAGLGIAATASAVTLRLDVAVPAATRAADQVIPMKSGVAAGHIVHRVNPVYPPDARKAHIQGVVVVKAMIDKQGNVQALKVVSGPRELQTSALDAVKQWKFQPFTKNGQPVEITTKIQVQYSLYK